MLNFKRVTAIGLKEMHHILHDIRTLMILFLMPLVQLIIFGYAMNMEIRHVPLAVIDYAKSTESRELISNFSHTEYFSTFSLSNYTAAVEEIFLKRKAKAVLVIPYNYGKDTKDVQLLIDASEPNNAQLIQSYVLGIVNSTNSGQASPMNVLPVIMFNPDLKSAYFFVPGLIAMILVMISALLTSISISREKEMGTLEQILVSPVSASEILVGKVLPYIVLALMDALLILGVGMFLFHVPFNGDFLSFLGFTFLYVLTALCLGLLISTVAKTQQAAMMMALGATLLPTLMLAGFMFPIASMPWILQKLTYMVPARYYLQIIRGIMLKGNSINELWVSGLCLAGMSVVMLFIASKRFSLRLK